MNARLSLTIAGAACVAALGCHDGSNEPRVVIVTVVVAAAGFRAAPRAGASGPPVWTHSFAAGPWGVAADRAGTVVVTDAPSVEALDRRGHLRWHARVDSLVEMTPALGGGRVLVGGRGLVTEPQPLSQPAPMLIPG